MDPATIYNEVTKHYGDSARSYRPAHSDAVAQAFGYTAAELDSIPTDANLGLSCGNPFAMASLRPGETVVDLGCGAGFDVFLAAKKVGNQGQVVGVDMNEDMLARARKNYTAAGSPSNISFVQGKITSIPMNSGIVDCVISNCVINLVPSSEKFSVFAEMARILKPGGRIALSDILARKPFPEGLRKSIAAYVGCIAGCSPKEDYEQYLVQNGFQDITIVDTKADLNIYTAASDDQPSDAATNAASQATEGSAACCAHVTGEQKEICGDYCTSQSRVEGDAGENWNLTDIDVNEWAGSFKIFAVKGHEL